MELPELPKPESYMFQHEETGQAMFVDAQQVEWGFEKNNPRLHKVSQAFTASQMLAYAEEAVLREREACAKLVEDYDTHGDHTQCWQDNFAAAIRNRKETT